MKKDSVAVALSGGVDSSVAALLLQKTGYTVIGLTACFLTGRAACRRSAACNTQAVSDAARVCRRLGIPHVAVDLSAEFKNAVIAPFVAEYLSGRTPNPCVVCNTLMKFGALRLKARSLGAGFFATGHYCRIERQGGIWQLVKARDRSKDQSYFLYGLTQQQRARTLFPLGAFRKEQVRRMARENRLPVAHKPESQEACFFLDRDYRAFIKRQMAGAVSAGPVVDAEGKVLGTHRGFPFYTIGQRQGLGVALGYPVYVTAIDPASNRLTVGSRAQASSRECFVRQVRWSIKAPQKKIAAKVRIRYNHKDAKAYIVAAGSKARIIFAQPQFAVTPGQSAVFYDHDRVLGGGIIEKAAGQ